MKALKLKLDAEKARGGSRKRDEESSSASPSYDSVEREYAFMARVQVQITNDDVIIHQHRYSFVGSFALDDVINRHQRPNLFPPLSFSYVTSFVMMTSS